MKMGVKWTPNKENFWANLRSPTFLASSYGIESWRAMRARSRRALKHNDGLFFVDGGSLSTASIKLSTHLLSLIMATQLVGGFRNRLDEYVHWKLKEKENGVPMPAVSLGLADQASFLHDRSIRYTKRYFPLDFLW